MKLWFLLLILSAGCASRTGPPLPPSPAKAAVESVAPQAEPQAGTQPPTLTILWCYPATNLTPDLVFILRSATSLALPPKQWPVRAILPQDTLQYSIAMTNDAEFFSLTASNRYGESEPATLGECP